MCDSKISANQFLICWFIKNQELLLLKRYNRINKISGNDIEYLINNDFLLDTNLESENYNFETLVVTPKFNEFYGDKWDIGMELWDTYRSWILIDGVPKSSKSAMSQEELINFYYKVIEGNYELHKSIIKILKRYNSQNDYVEWGIQKFVGSKLWEPLQKMYSDNNTDNNIQYGGNEF